VVNFVVPVTRDERLWEGAAADDFPRLRVGLPLLRARLSDEPLVIDHAAADVADHDAVLLPAAATDDALLVHDLFDDACAVDDFTVEIRVFVEDASEVRADGCVSSCNDGAACVFDDAVG